MAASRFVAGIGAFAELYKGFVIDQWGVLHDGIRPYPGVPEALAALAGRDKRIVLLSNSGRRATVARERLRRIGFDLGQFTAVVTSGETAWQGLQERALPPFDRLGRRCLLLTREGDRTVAEGLEIVGSATKADFLFLSGVEPPPVTADDYDATLAECLRHGLPMLCTNPDLVAVTGSELTLAPGTVAMRYRAAGGTVHFVGKPHAPVYAACRQALPGLAAGEIVAIGDSLTHDIKGANDAGMAAAFVTEGIHAPDFAADTEPDIVLAGLCARHDARPDWVLARLVW